MKRQLLALLSFAAIGAFSLSAQQYEPKWVGDVVALQVDGDTIASPTEKANVKIKTSDSAGKILVGIGNTRRKAVIKGGRSTTQLEPNRPIYLIVRCKDNQTDPTSFIQVVKFEEKKKERKAEIANVNWLGSVSQGNMTYVPYEADRYGKDSYILTLQPQDGEFGVRIFNPDDVDEKVPIFNCLGVHEPAPNGN